MMREEEEEGRRRQGGSEQRHAALQHSCTTADCVGSVVFTNRLMAVCRCLMTCDTAEGMVDEGSCTLQVQNAMEPKYGTRWCNCRLVHRCTPIP